MKEKRMKFNIQMFADGENQADQETAAAEPYKTFSNQKEFDEFCASVRRSGERGKNQNSEDIDIDAIIAKTKKQTEEEMKVIIRSQIEEEAKMSVQEKLEFEMEKREKQQLEREMEFTKKQARQILQENEVFGEEDVEFLLSNIVTNDEEKSLTLAKIINNSVSKYADTKVQSVLSKFNGGNPNTKLGAEEANHFQERYNVAKLKRDDMELARVITEAQRNNIEIKY